MPDVDSNDPSARFINDTALRDLTHFTFRRDPSFLDDSDEDSGRAFYIIDYGCNRKVTFDTREPAPLSVTKERLFMEVLS